MNAKFIVPSCYTIHAHVITFNNYETEIIYTDDVVFEFLTIFVDLERILDVFELIYCFVITFINNYKKTIKKIFEWFDRLFFKLMKI